MNNSKTKKITSGIMAGFCVLSSQTLVQYGLLKHDGSIATKNSSNLQAFGAFDKNVVGISGKNVGILNENNICNGLEYELNDKNQSATLKRCINKDINEVTIPKYVVGQNGKQYTVTSIGDNAFRDCKKLEFLTFAEGSLLETIGESTFYKCISLKRLEIPKTVTSIGANACRDCKKLEFLTFAEGSLLETIGEGAFNGCSGIKGRIEIPDKVTSLGDWAFNDCENLEFLTFAEGSSLQSIGYSAFNGCSSLQGGIEIPQNVTRIDGWAFAGCIKLEFLTFAKGSSLENIGAYAFNGCSSLQGGIEIPKNVTRIDEWAFNKCRKLEFLTFAEGSLLETIGTGAFYFCDSLKGEIDLPETVTSIGESAFYYCMSLQKIILHEGLEIIGNRAFYYCIGLEGVMEIPKTVTSIGDWALNDCRKLTAITFEEGSLLKSIGAYAFYGCSGIKGGTEIPKTVTSLGTGAFAYCKKLEAITLYENLTSLGTGVFDVCDKLQSIYIPQGAPCRKDLEAQGLGEKIKPLVYAENNASEESGFVQDTNNFVEDTTNKENMGNQITIAVQDSVSFDSELMLGEEGSSKSLVANLYENITASSVDNSQISDSFKNSTKKVINKLEDILQVKDNTSNSLVIDVSSVNEDINKNEITLNLDKSYIDKEVYITCIYDENNIFYLTGDGKWEKLTEETKEVESVKISTSGSINFQGMMKQCVFIITRKD